ncbi:MAG: MerR family transcriptional regulator [Alteripontixanthobacter sp.]
MAGSPFDDGKDAGALRTIGEVAKALRIKPHVLRYWEQQFSALEPLKRSGGRRYYRPEDVKLVERIDRLVNHEGYTLKGAAQALKSAADEDGEAGSVTAVPAETPSAELPVSGAAIRVPAELLAGLKSIRADLAAALDR